MTSTKPTRKRISLLKLLEAMASVSTNISRAAQKRGQRQLETGDRATSR